MNSYNKYLTDGIHSGEIESIEYCGIRIYKVRRPKDDEEVQGYINFAGFLGDRTATEVARSG